MELAVIVPAKNGGQPFSKCLEAIWHSTRKPDALIVVDDASTDDTCEIALRNHAAVIHTGSVPVGPALARNAGAAAAQQEIVIFIDADVVVHADTFERMETYFIEHPEVAAIFGSYDDHPPHRSLVSLYKNLQHHYVHQHGRQEASTFWSGCGAVRREVFQKLGGFNRLYSRPSIEDIEFGSRLKQAGYRIWLCRDVQATHLKKWTFGSWLRTDIFDRAVPWSKLICDSPKITTDLNLDHRSRFSALAAWLMVLSLLVSLVYPLALLVALAMLVLILYNNFDLYRFFYRKGGFAFGIGATLLHILYYLYSSITFLIIRVIYLVNKVTSGLNSRYVE